MDTLYIGDIPLENNQDLFIYYDDDGFPVLCENPAHFSDDETINTYILLNNLPTNNLIYEASATDVSLIRDKRFYKVNVSHNWYDRKDSLTILSTACVFIFFIVILFNLVTSIFKKGGLLSGLI